jgi:hypothetical protein
MQLGKVGSAARRIPIYRFHFRDHFADFGKLLPVREIEALRQNAATSGFYRPS